MKTKEELNALKEELEALNKKLAELTEEELAEIAGGFMVNSENEKKGFDVAVFPDLPGFP